MITCLNASNWKAKQVSGEIVYYAGCYPGGSPDLWCKTYHAFACVFSNPVSGTITAVRDHFGCEPFYYYWDQQRFIFASSIPDIIRSLDKHPEFNTPRIVTECFSVDQVFTPDYSNETFYKNIYRIEPGHFIAIENNKIIDNSFWELDPEAPSVLYKNEGDYLAQFSLLLDEAIQNQTKKVARLGAEFSGGLDSSAVLVGCHRLNLAPQLFCHIAPPNSGFIDDMLQARCVVEKLNFKNVHYVDAKNFDPITVLIAFN